jgi:signal transduction histidine kinase
MGKAKITQRITLSRQILYYYIKVIGFTLVTSLVLILASYFSYHLITGFHSIELKSAGIVTLTEYVNNSCDEINHGEYKELSILTDKLGLDYYIKDTSNHIIYKNNADNIGNTNASEKSFTNNLITEMLDHIVYTSEADIPILDPDTGKVSRILVLTQNNNSFIILFILVDICIPIVCLIAYTLIFSKSLGRNIKKPLDKLIKAVEKIKNQDLDFKIDTAGCKSNEIGDLIQAFEDMRINLKESLIREWQSEQDRRDMVSAITHDLRTPLAIISGHIELLQNGLVNDKNKMNSYLDIIEQNVHRAKILIDDMNSLTEIDNNNFYLNRSEEDITQFLNNKFEEYNILTAGKAINIEATITDNRDTAGPVIIDSQRLSQVFDNIIGNSIYYTPERGSIFINARLEKNAAYFTISDSGTGFSEKDLKNLFKKFYKGDSSRSREKGHSGLGLYIARSIIEKYGGTITAYNLPNGGASLDFNITY